MMWPGRAPPAWAASTYSWLRSTSRWVRTRRASVGQPMRPRMTEMKKNRVSADQVVRHEGGERHEERDRRHGPDRVGDHLHHPVDPAAEIACQPADHQGHDKADQHAQRAHRERRVDRVQRAREDVLARRIGAEEVDLALVHPKEMQWPRIRTSVAVLPPLTKNCSSAGPRCRCWSPSGNSSRWSARASRRR